MRAASARAAPADSPPRRPRWPTNTDGAGLAGPQKVSRQLGCDDGQQVGRRVRDALRAGRLELFSAVPSPSHAERCSAGEARFAHVAGRVAHEPVARLPREPRDERLDLGDLAAPGLGPCHLGDAGDTVPLEEELHDICLLYTSDAADE